VAPPLLGNHAPGTAVRVVEIGDPVGAVARTAPAGASELRASGDTLAGARAGDAIAIGDEALADVHEISDVGAEPGALELPADTFATITGRIVDAAERGVPITSATVVIAEQDRATITDARGAYRFAGIAGGTYTLRASAAGFDAATKSVSVPSTSHDEYEVRLTPN
jgi:carboxypeptidase family protein